MELNQLRNVRMVQNFHLVWLDENIDIINNDGCRSSIAKLREIVNTVNTFVDADQCVDFITDRNEQAFMVISEEFSRNVIPIVQSIDQVSGVYIYCGSNAPYETLTEERFKWKDVSTDITSVCEALRQAVQDYDHNSTSISFVKTTERGFIPSRNTLDPSFMYTQIMKDILLTIQFEHVHFNEFITYCRDTLVNNASEQNNVDRIEQEYYDRQPIWWYTHPGFLYSMLNKALRTMEIDLITKMGFFIRDLHTHIATLHAEQYGEGNTFHPFTIYRGQGLSETDFDRLKATKGGLLAFNNFLSTSYHRDVSLRFAQRAIKTSNLVGILFVIKIDPSVSTTPLANITNVSCYPGEEEILFSMHSVFRLESIKQIDENDPLWKVDLTLTSDNDPQLQDLMNSVQEETKRSTGWLRLTTLMIKLGELDKVEHMLNVILRQTSDKIQIADIYNQLGWINNGQGKYADAIKYYTDSMKIYRTVLPANHPHLASLYNNIGGVYMHMGEHAQALTYYEKALDICQKCLPVNHPNLAVTYGNIGGVYTQIGEYSKAIAFYEKTLEIQQKTLPANHPELAISYNNIGHVYENMSEYSKALSYYEKALEIKQKAVPENHPTLATSYNNIGVVYDNMGDYSKARLYYEKALEIWQKALPAHHPNLAISYSNIGVVYENMGDRLKALWYYERALDIVQLSLPSDHPGTQWDEEC